MQLLKVKASAERLAIPAAFVDPAFQLCLIESSGNLELVENFDRLTGCKVGRIASSPAIQKMVDEATGFHDDQLRQFAEFVHDCVTPGCPMKQYMHCASPRLPQNRNRIPSYEPAGEKKCCLNRPKARIRRPYRV
jgi:hypothetical protein